MQTPKIDQYFSKKNIKVLYNVLGHTEELVNAYVSTFNSVVELAIGKRSQHVKHDCYNKLYSLENRRKLTGFEDLKARDNKFRNKIVCHLDNVFYGPTLTIKNTEIIPNLDYKTCLLKSLKNIDNPILYLSGGLDSEVLAHALLDAGIKFVPVAFKWTNNLGHIVNESELEYAIKFCKNHNITLDMMELNVEELWESNEFFTFAQDIQLQSTQQLTHAYVVNLVNDKYPNSTHLFGGEVRFYIENQDSDIVNVVFLDKVNPPTYNGNTYAVSSGGIQNCAVQLVYYGDTGQFQVESQVGGNPIIVQASGLWTTTPAPIEYEYRISNVTVTTDMGAIITPAGSSITFSPIGTSGQVILCKVLVSAAGGTDKEGDVTFEIKVRSIANPAIEVTSTITLQAVYIGVS